MKVDMKQEIIDFKGEVMKSNDEVLDLKAVCCEALISPLPGDDKMGWKEKQKLGELGRAVWKGKSNFKSDQVSMIKDRIGKRFPISIVEPACRLIEGEKLEPEATLAEEIEELGEGA